MKHTDQPADKYLAKRILALEKSNAALVAALEEAYKFINAINDMELWGSAQPALDMAADALKLAKEQS